MIIERQRAFDLKCFQEEAEASDGGQPALRAHLEECPHLRSSEVCSVRGVPSRLVVSEMTFHEASLRSCSRSWSRTLIVVTDIATGSQFRRSAEI